MNDDMCQNTENVEEHYAFSIITGSSETKDSFAYVTLGGVQV